MRSLKSMRPRDNIIGIDSNLVYNDPFPLDKLTIEQSACPLCVKFLSSKPSALFYSAKLSTQDAALLASSKMPRCMKSLLAGTIRPSRLDASSPPPSGIVGLSWVSRLRLRLGVTGG
jgi:hypothetical protein